ncbi:MAG: MFS transporter [Candidatus Omnitrophota bacterium]
MRRNSSLARFSWALYDFANTMFSMNIVSIYFVLWLTVDKGCPEVYYSLSLGGSIFLAAILMPLAGEISDTLKRKMPFLIAFSLGCVIFTALLGVTKGTLGALFFFACANFFYQLAGVVYDSLLPQISTAQTLGRTSGLGVSLGYLGAIFGLHLVRPFLHSAGKQAVFFPTAILFFLFALPAFIFIKDSPYPYVPRIAVRGKLSFSYLIKTSLQLRQNPVLSRFLLAAFLCLNAVNTTIAFMGVYAQRVMRFSDSELIYFMSVSTIFAIGGSYIFGHCVDRRGARNTLNIVIKSWCVTIFLAGIAFSRWMFWIVGPMFGICLGATWVCARTMLIELVPREQIGQMFGLFGLAGRLSAILGPIVWGLITTWIFAGWGVFKYRIALGSVFIFMFAGYLVFQGVREPQKVTDG